MRGLGVRVEARMVTPVQFVDVKLHSLDRSRLPRHTFPGSTFHSARQANTKLEPPVIIVADAQQHLELLQIGHFILEVADEAGTILRPIIIELCCGLPALLLHALWLDRQCEISTSRSSIGLTGTLSMCSGPM